MSYAVRAVRQCYVPDSRIIAPDVVRKFKPKIQSRLGLVLNVGILISNVKVTEISVVNAGISGFHAIISDNASISNFLWVYSARIIFMRKELTNKTARDINEIS